MSEHGEGIPAPDPTDFLTVAYTLRQTAEWLWQLADLLEERERVSTDPETV